MLPVNQAGLQQRADDLLDVPSNLRGKAKEVMRMFRGFGRVIIAFSGGIDSTLVAYLGKLAVGDNAIGVTADSPSLSSAELEHAKSLAKQIGINHVIIKTEELDDPRYSSNPVNRCYFCKKELSVKLKRLAAELHVSVIVDGTNADDLLGHRPGGAALVEEGVRRPLAEVCMTKAEVRELSKLLRLPNFDKPSVPCLSSRVQYGQRINPERLKRIEKSESLIRSLTGVRELRVRDHGNLARIEVAPGERRCFFDEELLDEVARSLREFGFTYVCFDLMGYKSGSMNESMIAGQNRSGP
jgi:uncharacterized protein